MRKWIARCGVMGLVFFTLKGLAWLALGAAAISGATEVMR